MIERIGIRRAAVAALLACFAAVPSAYSQGAPAADEAKPGRAGSTVTRDGSRFTWSESNDGVKVEVMVEGLVEPNEDYSDVASIPTDGRFTVEDNRGAVARRYRVVRGAGGGLARTYTVGGRERAPDAEAQEWLRRVMLEAVRQGGLFAEERAQKLLRERGGRGLSEELTHLRGDHVRRLYFEALITSRDLDDATLAEALGSLGIVSDYERAQLLIKASDSLLGRDKLVPVYFEAVGKIKSDYEHRRVLSALIRRGGLSPDALVAAIRSVAGVRSDYEKATWLIQVARLKHGDERVRAAFAEALRGIGSEYERGRVERAAACRAGAN